MPTFPQNVTLPSIRHISQVTGSHIAESRTLDRYKRRILSTLDPNRLQESDFVDISFYKNFTLRLQSNIPDSFEPSLSSPFKFAYSWSRHNGSRRNEFPRQSSGFFYYHSPGDLSPLAGGLRFRRTDTSSPQSFSSGVDLLWPNGLPWSYPLHRLARDPAFSRVLVNDGLITEELLVQCREVFRERTNFKWSTPLLFHLSQPFSIPRNKNFTSIFAVVSNQLLGPAIISTKNILEEFRQLESNLDHGSVGHVHARLVQSKYGMLGAELLAVQHAANTPALQVPHRKPVLLKSFRTAEYIEPLYLLARG
ncbi:hypothetical protein GYMLUDRAFT_53043 [Collybiopsis luxurians FD-317 M1]|nr:hypothetical protein GYMLUDRAFT_53043 [Collybiopsis luxurians FD-317 M1]